MEQRCRFDGLKLYLAGYAHLGSQAHCVVLNASNMSVSDLVFSVDCHGQRFYGR